MARTPLLTLSTETWGDKLHRAYRHARAQYGQRRDPETGKAKFSYQVVAEKLTAAGLDVSDQLLLRLEESEEIPARMRQRQIAYFALIAYGYDPADFGLTSDNVSLSAFDINKVKRAVAPSFSWSPRPLTLPKVHETPGQKRFPKSAA